MSAIAHEPCLLCLLILSPYSPIPNFLLPLLKAGRPNRPVFTTLICVSRIISHPVYVLQNLKNASRVF